MTNDAAIAELVAPMDDERSRAERELEGRPLHRDPSVGGTDGSYATSPTIAPSRPASASWVERLAMPLGIIDQGVVSATNFATTVVVGKFAGVTALGEYAVAFTVLVLLLTVQDCFVASPYTVFHEEYRGRARRVFRTNLLLLALAIAAVAAGMLLLAGLLSDSIAGLGWLRPVATALAIATPPALLREALRRFALSHLDLVRALLVDCVAGAAQLGALALLVAGPGLSSSAALIALAIGGAGGALVWLVTQRRALRLRRATLLAHWRRALSFGKWLCAARLADVIDNYTVPWLIALLLGLEAVGGFIAADTLIAAANPFLMGFTNILAPQAARAWSAGGVPALRRVVLRSTLVLTGLTAVFAAGIAALGPWLLGLLYGEEYAGFGTITALLALGLLLGIVGVAADHGLRAMHRPQATLVASLAGLAVTAVCTVGLVSAVGAIGGAYALALGCAVSSGARLTAFGRITSLALAEPPGVRHDRGT